MKWVLMMTVGRERMGATYKWFLLADFGVFKYCRHNKRGFYGDPLIIQQANVPDGCRLHGAPQRNGITALIPKKDPLILRSERGGRWLGTN